MATVNGCRLEPVDCGYNRDAALLEFDFKGVSLLALHVELVEFSRDLDGDDLFAGGGFHSNADDLSFVRCPTELLIDLALN